MNYSWLKSEMWENSGTIKDERLIHEPIIHWIDDKLKNGHPMSYQSVYCNKCNEMLHAANNEFMKPWVESGNGNYCMPCFSKETINCMDEMVYALRKK